MKARPRFSAYLALTASLALAPSCVSAQQSIVLHAGRLLQVVTGTLLHPGEILIQGDKIRAVGTSVDHPANARIIDLGDTTLLPASSTRTSISFSIPALKIFKPCRSPSPGALSSLSRRPKPISWLAS